MPLFVQRYFFLCALCSVLLVIAACANFSPGNSAIQITPSSALVLPGGNVQFSVASDLPNLPPSFLWTVNRTVGGDTAAGTISENGLYAAPRVIAQSPIQVGIQEQGTSATVRIFDPSHPIPGAVSSTQNPLVAAYSISVPADASVSVQFGLDSSYGFSTSNILPPVAGGSTTVLVAGMRASTTYHMQAIIHMPDGSQLKDVDQTFTTGAIAPDRLPDIATQLTGIGTPSSGVELLSLTQSSTQNLLCAVATDLGGNVIWYYDLPVGAFAFPIKPLSNGHMLILTYGTVNDVREIDLAGNIIHQVTAEQVADGMSNIPSFMNMSWGDLNHDVQFLPNGHLILLAGIGKNVNDVPGIANGTFVAGNALIDWDPKHGAVWTWSTFNHLDLTRAPYGADWTHGNAVIYSPDDGDLIFSMRNQNWVIKINYQDGAGDGSILWRLGPDGDFSMPGQQAPIELNYGQHYPTIVTPNSSGVFSLMFFNNGNNRLMNSNNEICGTTGVDACYSSVPIFELNEYTKTATVVWEDNLNPAYSICCGDALILPNGNIEFDVAADVNSPNSYIEEVTQTQSPELVWRMDIGGQLAYRGFRIPSLYPGQVWSAMAQQVVRPTSPDHRMESDSSRKTARR